MKRCVIFLFLATFGFSAAQAQTIDSLASVIGILTDSLTGKPIPFATVSLVQQATVVSGAISDSLGRFSLNNMPYGSYVLRFSVVGYRPGQSPVWTVDAAHPTVNMGIVGLRQDAQNLKAVTVRGQKPLIEDRVDGITFNVESFPSIAGSNASDVLRKVPMLSVDANGGLSMRGSANIRVFIDGKPTDMYASSVADALKAISGESIVKVEVITHPSARYDAEGSDGVVHIITRKLRTNATNGNVSGTLGNRSDVVIADIQRRNSQWLVKMDGFYQTYWNRNGSVLTRETARFALFSRMKPTKGVSLPSAESTYCIALIL